MKNKKVIMIVVLVICLLLLLFVMIFMNNKDNLKKDDFNDDITIKEIQKDSSGLEIDYTKEYTIYNIDMGLSNFKDISLIKNDENILKEMGAKVEFVDDNINYYGNDKVLFSFKNSDKVLYNLYDVGSEYLNTFILYDNNCIKVYKVLSSEDSYVEKTILSSNNEIGVNWNLSSNNIDFSDIYLKNEDGEFSNFNDNTIIYSKDSLENVIWYKDNIVVNKDKEVYYRGKKINGLKFLAVIMEDDADGLFVNGVVSSDNYYYTFNKGNVEKKKIQNMVTKVGDINLSDITNVSVQITFTDGTSLENDFSMYIGKINYYKNL